MHQNLSKIRDEENDPNEIYEFVAIPSFAAVVSCTTSEPFYFTTVVEKNLAEGNLRGRFGHGIFPG